MEELCWSLVLVVVVGGDFFIFVGIDEFMFWWWVGDDGGEEWFSWMVLVVVMYGIVNIVWVVVCCGCFYMLDDDGYVFVIDVGVLLLFCVEKFLVVSLFDGDYVMVVFSFVMKGYLFEFDGEVFFVWLVFVFKDEVGCVGGVMMFCNYDVVVFFVIFGFEVYWLDLKDSWWVSVKKLLGDWWVLFVSYGLLFVVCFLEMVGCSSNCIYFVGNKWYCFLCNSDVGKIWGVYFMEDWEVLFEYVVIELGLCLVVMWFLFSVV